MAGLTALVAMMVAAAPAGAEAAPVDRWAPFIAEASARYGVPETWIRRVIAAESGGRTRLGGRPIVSRAGAMGLMQLMPGTWLALRRSERLGSDPHAPRDNIMAGTAYLRAMYERFGYPGLFAAYNAGPGRYGEHLRTGRPLPAETVAYVRQVAGEEKFAAVTAVLDAPPAGIFAIDRSGRPSGGSPPAPTLFVATSSPAPMEPD